MVKKVENKSSGMLLDGIPNYVVSPSIPGIASYTGILSKNLQKTIVKPGCRFSGSVSLNNKNF